MSRVASVLEAMTTTWVCRRNPSFVTSSTNTPAASGLSRYPPVDSETVLRATVPSSRVSRISAPGTAAFCASVTVPANATPCAAADIGARRHAVSTTAKIVRALVPLIVELLPMLSLREAANERRQHQARARVWNRGGMKTRLPTHALCSPQKVSRMKPWVGLLARQEQTSMPAGRFCLPRRLPSGVLKRRAADSQWRDRAGFEPDFPVMPLVGTQGRRFFYHLAAARRKSMDRGECGACQCDGSGAARRHKCDGAHHIVMRLGRRVARFSKP